MTDCKATKASGEPCTRPCAEGSEYCWQHGKSKSKEANTKMLKRIRDRYKIMSEADDENRTWALEDLRFVNEPGYQWDNNMKSERGDRPCYEFNKLRINGKRVINEIRANRPQGKVLAVENGDKKGAELREGLCRNIANISDFETITDYEAEYQVDAGLGAWRIDTEYSSDSMFDQDIKINAIKNPFCLYWDPSCKDLILKRDAADWLLVDHMPVKAFEDKYGDADQFDFDTLDEGTDDWEDEETVRVVEYWYKEPTDKELWLVERPTEDGKTERITVDSTSDEAVLLKEQGIKPVKTRTVHTHKIMMCVASGKAILEGPVEAPGSMFPFVVVHGEIKVVDGKVRWWGLHRFSKDAQRSYNVSRTAIDETIAAAPKSHTWATTAQAEGLLESWAEAHKKNLPVRLYNADPNNPGPPVHHGGAEVPIALMQQAVISSQDIRDTSGLHEASFGEESGEKSGIALARKQAQGQIVTYNFPDNMAKRVKRTWEIMLDRIPIVYDADRELRVIGVDGAEDYARVNQVVFDPKTGTSVRVNDMTSGKYDVAISTGPSYTTLRQESAEVYGEFISRTPEMMNIAGDLFFKSLDYPYADEIAERIQTILPPQIQQMLSKGKEIPPEAQAVMRQANQMMEQVQQHGQLVQQAAQEVEEGKADLDKTKAEIRTAIADLKREEAEFKAVIAEQIAKLSIRESELKHLAEEVGEDSEQFQAVQQAISAQQEAISVMDQLTAQYIEAASGALGDLNERVSKPQPKLTKATTSRDKGQLIAEMTFDDGSIKRLGAKKVNGRLEAVPIE